MQILASVSRNDVVWVLQNFRKEEILSYFTLKDIVVHCTTKALLSEICNGVYKLHFIYFSSPQKRGEYLENSALHFNCIFLIKIEGESR